jgi:hypothetical protein
MYVYFHLKDALEKLRQRQKAELQETDALLEELYNEDQRNHLEDEEVSSLALSILSGVDYGFRSRSEGAASGLAGGYAVDGIDTKGYVCARRRRRWLFPFIYFAHHAICCKNSFYSPKFETYGPPGNIIMLGSQQFMRNLYAMIGEYKDEADIGMCVFQRVLEYNLVSLWHPHRLYVFS